MPNTLYYGDDLQVLRDHVLDESVDLVRLTPRLTPRPPMTSFARHTEYEREKKAN